MVTSDVYGGTMKKHAFVALMALCAAPVSASPTKAASAGSAGSAVDMLYPEIAVDDDGWRGLLPVILLNTEELAKPTPSADEPAQRSERSEQR